jgi:hypothetical protein
MLRCMQLTGGRHRVSQRRYPEDKAKCVAYATYTVVSSYTVTTGPFHKSYKSGSSRLQPSEPAAAVHVVTNLTASTRSDVLASESDLVHSEDRICFDTCRWLCWEVEVGPGWQLNTLLTTGYANHTIYIQYIPMFIFPKYAMFCQ